MVSRYILIDLICKELKVEVCYVNYIINIIIIIILIIIISARISKKVEGGIGI